MSYIPYKITSYPVIIHSRVLQRFQKSWIDLMTAYETSQERLQEGGVFDQVLDHIRDDSKSDAISFNEAATTMAEIIFANKDVLQPALIWLFTDLLTYPTHLETLPLPKSWETIDKATLETNFPDLLHLIQESSRVHPPIPTSLPEITDKELQLGNYMLPKGTKVSIDLYSMNHNPKYWSSPHEFIPDRFKELDLFTAKWGFFRFGFGGRRCPGQYYANLILANATARLFSRFKLIPVNKNGISNHQDVPLLGPGFFTMLPDVKVTVIEKCNLTKAFIYIHNNTNIILISR